jgi:hypothetical protein
MRWSGKCSDHSGSIRSAPHCAHWFTDTLFTDASSTCPRGTRWVKPKNDGDIKTRPAGSSLFWINRASEMCNRPEQQPRRSPLLRLPFPLLRTFGDKRPARDDPVVTPPPPPADGGRNRRQAPWLIYGAKTFGKFHLRWRGSHRRRRTRCRPCMLICCATPAATRWHDTRAIQGLAWSAIQHTIRYTELSPTRFRDFWR